MTYTKTTDAIVRTTCITVYPVDPATDREAHNFALAVEYRDEDKFAIVWHRDVYDFKTDEFVYEPSPSNREDDFIEDTRRSQEVALAKAKELVPKLRVNGRTYDEWQEHFATLKTT